MDLAYERMTGDLDHYGIYDEVGTNLDPLYHMQDVAEGYASHELGDDNPLTQMLSKKEFTDENEFFDAVAPLLKTPKDRYEFYKDSLRSWSRNMGEYESGWDNEGGRPHNDMVVVSDWKDIKHLDPDKIGVVPVSIRRGATVHHNQGEEELSTGHHNVLVGDYDYHQKNARDQGWLK